MTKHELRKHIRLLKQNYPEDLFIKDSLEIEQKIISSKRYNDASTILMYSALPDEVQTFSLITDAYLKGKKVLLPAMTDTDMKLMLFKGSSKMKMGRFGILEPIGETFTDYKSIELAIIPGIAFDHQNHRMGRGKGSYDRILPFLTNAYKIGICFKFQMFDSIPYEPFDFKMDMVMY